MCRRRREAGRTLSTSPTSNRLNAGSSRRREAAPPAGSHGVVGVPVALGVLHADTHHKTPPEPRTLPNAETLERKPTHKTNVAQAAVARARLFVVPTKRLGRAPAKWSRPSRQVRQRYAAQRKIQRNRRPQVQASAEVGFELPFSRPASAAALLPPRRCVRGCVGGTAPARAAWGRVPLRKALRHAPASPRAVRKLVSSIVRQPDRQQRMAAYRHSSWCRVVVPHQKKNAKLDLGYAFPGGVAIRGAVLSGGRSCPGGAAIQAPAGARATHASVGAART